MEGILGRDGRLHSAEDNKYRYYQKTFIYSVILACCITVPFVVMEWIRTGHGVFLYYGDYNVQQLAFYRHCVDMVHSGEMGWDWYTDMGSNFVGSYSYYMLGSPFFWFMCLFPSSWAPYLMGPVYILKYITAAMIAYAYLQRWVKNKDYAVLGALLYAFSGFQIYNTFFNQYHEVVAFFPLLLIGMEEYVQNNRKGVFALAVCLNAMVNYFMFAGQVAFCIMYFLFRFTDRSFRITLKKFLGLFFEAVIGALMSMVLFLPAALGLLGNDRVGHSFKFWQNSLFYYSSYATKEEGTVFAGGKLYWQRYGQIFESYFFPPDIPSRVNFFHGHKERWASISGYLPMFGMAGVFAFFRNKRRNWLKGLIVFLILCSFVPILNSLFFLGQTAYYARWMYLMVMMFVLSTILALDNEKTRWKGALALDLSMIAAVFIPLGLLWYDKPDTENKVDYQLGRAPFPTRFWLYTAIAIAGVIAVWYLIKHFRGTKVFTRAMLIATSVFIVTFGCLHIGNGKEHGNSATFMTQQALFADIQLPDVQDEFYRVDFYRTSNFNTIDNLGIFWKYPSIECFHTVIPPSIMTFYDILDYNRSVGSRTESAWYGLRSMTSTKYSFIESSKNGLDQTVTVNVEDTSSIKKYDESKDWTCVSETETERVYQKEKFDTSRGWKYIDTQCGFDIYENEYVLPMGFAYDEFMTLSEFKKTTGQFERANLLCTYLIVPDDQAEYYAQFMTEKTNENRAKSNFTTYQKSIEARKATACTDFTFDTHGFSANFESDKERIVFFSVPDEGGWSATVNGEKAEILRVFDGFMAVQVPEGKSEIVFKYRTFGILPGLAMTGAALLIFGLYMAFWKWKKHKADYKFFDGTYYEAGDVDLPPREKKSILVLLQKSKLSKKKRAKLKEKRRAQGKK